MNELLFKNDFFKSERLHDDSIAITILKDENKFFGINLEGCKLITNKDGYIEDIFSDNSIKAMHKYLSTHDNIFNSYDKLKIELRNRTLNVLISHISCKKNTSSQL